MMITFSNPGFLFLLFAIPAMVVLHSLTLNIFKRRAIKFANFDSISKIKGIEFFSKDLAIFYLAMFLLVLIVLALSGLKYVSVRDSAISSYILVIDSSSSMTADDLSPNRFSVAKNSALEFVDHVPFGTRVGLVTFSGVPFIELEVSEDKSLLKSTINDLEIKKAGGTNILDSIVTASNLLLAEETKSIILISDGQINIHNLKEVIAYANKNDVIVYAIGIGTAEGGKTGMEYISKIDEDILKSLAYNTEGKYFHVVSEEEADLAFSEIVEKVKKKQSIDLSVYLMLVVFIFIFIWWFLSSTRFKYIP